MKNIQLPILRTFLLLTICVGLLGNAKILLLHKNQLFNQSLLVSSNISSHHLPVQTMMSESLIIREQQVETQTLINKKPSIAGNSLITGESKVSAVSGDTSINDKLSLSSIQEPSSETFAKEHKESKESQVDTPEESLSESITNDSMKLTIASLEKAIKEASRRTYRQTESSVYGNTDLPNVKNSYAYKNDYAFQNDLAIQAEKRLQSNVTYDGRYVRISYPMGDVPAEIGVCTDVVIRAYRGLGIDLQQRVHEDMKRNFRSYPNNWQLTRPDSNIDHRRVPNLMKYFKRAGASVAISSNPLDYHAGDIVTWDMGNGLTHIGIVSTYVSEKSGNPLIVHNIGVGPEMTDVLFDFKIIGHYKYGPKVKRKIFKPKMANARIKDSDRDLVDLMF